jgi:hypothetical protein
MGLSDQTDDRQNKNERHHSLRCQTKWAKGVDELNFNINQIKGEQEPNERYAE